MKEILQKKYLNLKSTTACASAHVLHVRAFPLHVEHVDQEFIAVEEEAEAEDQEQQL